MGVGVALEYQNSEIVTSLCYVTFIEDTKDGYLTCVVVYE